MKLKVRFGLILLIITVIFLGFVFLLYSDLSQSNGEYPQLNIFSLIPDKVNAKFCDELFSFTIVKEWRKTDIVLCFLMRYDFDRNVSHSISPWTLASSFLRHDRVHPDVFPELGYILNALSESRIIKADVGYRGTQLKLLLTLSGGQKVSFKPKWYEREEMIMGIYEGKDRHNGEIASYHLNRILGLNRAPIVTGRMIDLKEEILPVATPDLKKTFFFRNESYCFYGRCYYCKGVETGICAKTTKLEGSASLFFPSSYEFLLLKHPWARTYKPNKKARWELQPNEYCAYVTKKDFYNYGRILLDIMDVSIFDFIIGNADRHNFEIIKGTEESMFVLFDNGKSFGNPLFDEESILAPLMQCCKLRNNLWRRLKILKNGVLGTVLEELLKKDELLPILHYTYYSAMDRRLRKIIDVIGHCIDIHGKSYVLID